MPRDKDKDPFLIDLTNEKRPLNEIKDKRLVEAIMIQRAWKKANELDVDEPKLEHP